MCIVTELAKAKQRIAEQEAKIAELEKQLNPPAPPTIKGIISSGEIWNLIQSIFPDQMNKVHLSDAEYEITAISELRRFVEWDNTNIFPYIKEVHDCDDFAAALAGDFAKYPDWSGYPVTDIWGDYLGGHAFIKAIAWPSFEDRTPTVYYIEPQNDWEISQEIVEGMNLWLLAL